MVLDFGELRIVLQTSGLSRDTVCSRAATAVALTVPSLRHSTHTWTYLQILSCFIGDRVKQKGRQALIIVGALSYYLG